MSTTNLPTLWSVEVSDGQKLVQSKEQAYRYAEELQSDGRNVEVYEDGILRSKLRSQKQYSLFV
jgi:hypothetical protein